jgi:hypothetical protein
MKTLVITMGTLLAPAVPAGSSAANPLIGPVSASGGP